MHPVLRAFLLCQILIAFRAANVSGATATAFELRAFSPSIAGVGEKVALEGTGFKGATAVTFNGNASVFRVVSDERIVATVPMGSVEGVIEIWKEDVSTSLPIKFVLDRTHTSSIVGWGAQSFQFGQGQEVAPADLTNAVAIAAGTYSSAAITADKRLRVWGMFSNLPPALRTNEFTAVAANNGLILGVDTTGRLRSHRFDEGGFAYMSFPAGATNIIAVTWGLALRRDGAVFGLATEQTPFAPSRLIAMPPATAIVGSMWGGLALHRNGRCSAWSDFSPETIAVPLTNVVALSEGGDKLLLLTQAGELFEWDQHFHSVRKVDSNVARAAGNYYYRITVKEDGRIVTSGSGGWGQTNVPPYLSNVAALSCNMAHVLALARLSPKIVVQPVDLDGLPGATLRLRAKVVGDRPMSFQWFHNGAWMAGQTNVDLTLEALGADTAGEYQLIAWNERGVIASDLASVNIVEDFTAFGFSRPELPGSRVTIFGRGLDHATAVTFNGNAAVFWPLDENRLEAIVPEGIVSGKVRVWLNGAFSEVSETYVAPSDPQLLIAWNFQFGLRFMTSSQDGFPFVAISAGDQFGAALRGDGKVFTWRYDATALGAVSPISSTTNAIAISVGSTHNAALKADGTVAGWGGPTAPAPKDLNGVTAVAAGVEHSLALLEDGTVRGWGDNTEKAAEPPPGLRDVVKVVALDCSIAIKRDGTAVIWGGRYLEPKIIRGPSRIIDASSRFANLFLCEDGSTIVDYPGDRSPYVVPPAPIPPKAAELADYDKALGVRTNGTLFAWPSAQLTIGAFPPISKVTAIAAAPMFAAVLARQIPIIVRQPLDLFLPTGATGTISADVRFASSYQWFKDGQLVSTNATLVISSMAAARVGEYILKASNAVGEVLSRPARVQFLARPTISSFSPASGAVGDTIRITGSNLDKATAVSFNGNGAFFRVIDAGEIQAVVPNAWATGPVAVLFGDYRVQATGSFELTAREGRLLGWGGQHWDPLWFNPDVIPIPERAINPVLVNLEQDFSSVRVGSGETLVWPWTLPRAEGDPVIFAGDWTGLCAMTSAGRLLRAGGLSAPAFVDTGITDAVNIAAAPRAILRRNGTIFASVGALAPALAALTNVTALAGEYNFTAALRSDGTVTVVQKDLPTIANVPPEATNVVAAAAGFQHIIALRRDGTVVAWGYNDYRQIDVPPGLTDVIQIAAGGYHSFALTADGNIVAWGNSNNGQLQVPTTGRVTAISSSMMHGVATIATPPPPVAPVRLQPVGFVSASGNLWLQLTRENGVGAVDPSKVKVYASDDVRGPWNLIQAELVADGDGFQVQCRASQTNATMFFRVVESAE
jgi:hypothetical protein